jgi:mRNA interferase MazF
MPCIARNRKRGIPLKKKFMKSPISLRRGDIVRVTLDPVRGHEQAGVRPALVLSPEIVNAHYSTVMIAAITSTPLSIDLPIEVKIDATESGLKKNSRILLLQTRCIDKSRIIGDYGALSKETMAKVDQALAIVTGLMRI